MTRSPFVGRDFRGHFQLDGRVSLFGSSHPGSVRLRGLRAAEGVRGERRPRVFAAVADQGIFLALLVVGIALVALSTFLIEAFRGETGLDEGQTPISSP